MPAPPSGPTKARGGFVPGMSNKRGRKHGRKHKKGGRY